MMEMKRPLWWSACGPTITRNESECDRSRTRALSGASDFAFVSNEFVKCELLKTVES